MADKGFNGTTITFPTAAIAELRSVSYSVGGATVDVGASDDTAALFVNGRDDVEVTVEIVGGTTLSRGDTGAVTISWFDGTSDTLTNAVITQVTVSGSMDGDITTSVSLKETPA